MHSIAWWPTLIVLCVATFTDLRSRRIPNWLVAPIHGGRRRCLGLALRLARGLARVCLAWGSACCSLVVFL